MPDSITAPSGKKRTTKRRERRRRESRTRRFADYRKQIIAARRRATR